MLSIAILSAMTIFGLIILPALAEIRSRRREDQERGDPDDVRLPEEPGEMLAAA